MSNKKHLHQYKSIPPSSLVCFVQLLYKHQRLKQPIMQDQMQALYLPFLSALEPHWDNCPNVFAIVKSKRIQVKVNIEFQQESNKKASNSFSPFYLYRVDN